jgi:hypothetical protein
MSNIPTPTGGTSPRTMVSGRHRPWVPQDRCRSNGRREPDAWVSKSIRVIDPIASTKAKAMRHSVRYSNSAHHSFRDQTFHLHEDAIKFAENVLKQHKYVWLSEYGRYRNRGGKWITCWIYHWWSPAVTKTDWGECPDAGWGRPHGRRSLINYEPLLYKASRFAHLNVRASPTRETVKAPSSQGERNPRNAQGSRALVGVTDSEAVLVLPDWQ